VLVSAVVSSQREKNADCTLQYGGCDAPPPVLSRLMLAPFRYGHLDILRFLVEEAGANVNAKDM